VNEPVSHQPTGRHFDTAAKAPSAQRAARDGAETGHRQDHGARGNCAGSANSPVYEARRIRFLNHSPVDLGRVADLRSFWSEKRGPVSHESPRAVFPTWAAAADFANMLNSFSIQWRRPKKCVACRSGLGSFVA
jgi:hypothetical protein